MFCWISWLHVDRFSWDFYNRDSFDETIKNLLHLEDLFYCPLLPTFNLDTHTHTHIHTYIHTFGFIEKTSVKQDLKCKVCSNFQMSFFHLVRRTQNRWGFRSGWHFVRSSGQADLWSDIPPPSGFGSGWHLVTFWVRLTFGQTYSQPSGFGSG